MTKKKGKATSTIIKCIGYKRLKREEDKISFTQDNLHRLLLYDKVTGQFSQIGEDVLVESINNNGKITVSINGHLFHGRQVVWMYLFGHIPKEHIYRIDSERIDTIIDNLSLDISDVRKFNESKFNQQELKEYVTYDKESGNFYWRINGRGFKVGDIAGIVHKNDGYRRIGFNWMSFPAHRLAWLYVEGYLPENDIDHINRNRDDNRWGNLRHVSRSCNLVNSGIQSNNTSGVIGVSWKIDKKRWKAYITIGKKQVHLGYTNEFIDAVYIRRQGEIKYLTDRCNSSSSSYNYLINQGVATQ